MEKHDSPVIAMVAVHAQWVAPHRILLQLPLVCFLSPAGCQELGLTLPETPLPQVDAALGKSLSCALQAVGHAFVHCVLYPRRQFWNLESHLPGSALCTLPEVMPQRIHKLAVGSAAAVHVS